MYKYAVKVGKVASTVVCAFCLVLLGSSDPLDSTSLGTIAFTYIALLAVLVISGFTASKLYEKDKEIKEYERFLERRHMSRIYRRSNRMHR